MINAKRSQLEAPNVGRATLTKRPTRQGLTTRGPASEALVFVKR